MRVKKIFVCLFGFPLFYPRWRQMPAYRPYNNGGEDSKKRVSLPRSFPIFRLFSELVFLGMATRARLGGQQRETAAARTVTIDTEKGSKKSLIICPFFVLASATIQRIATCFEQRQKENYGLQHLL